MEAMKDIRLEDRRKLMFDDLRRMGKSYLERISTSFHPKSKIGEWDPEVYAGVMEKIDNFFLWNDIHWRLPKYELLLRVKEWNEALEL